MCACCAVKSTSPHCVVSVQKIVFLNVNPEPKYEIVYEAQETSHLLCNLNGFGAVLYALQGWLSGLL